MAVELLRAGEMLKARPTGADLEMLVQGAVTEASPEAALQVSGLAPKYNVVSLFSSPLITSLFLCCHDPPLPHAPTSCSLALTGFGAAPPGPKVKHRL